MTAWAEMSKADQELVSYYMRRSDLRELRLHGAKALEKVAEREALQERRQAWVTENGLSCVDCKATLTEWAAGGRNRWGKLYAICKTCVIRNGKKKGPSSKAQPLLPSTTTQIVPEGPEAI